MLNYGGKMMSTSTLEILKPKDTAWSEQHSLVSIVDHEQDLSLAN